MSLAFARHMSPDAPLLLAAVLSGRRRPKRLPWGHVWLRIADRLAAGMPPAAAGVPDGQDGRMVADLLAREEFRALVAAAEEQLAEPQESQRRRAGDHGPPGARAGAWRSTMPGRPCSCWRRRRTAATPRATLADGVLRSRKRALASAAMPAPPEPAVRPRPGRYRYDPLRRMMHRGSARLRQDVAVEDALCRAALLATAPEPTGAAATRAAAERALALKHASAPAALPHIVELRHGLCLRDGVLEPLDPAPASPASLALPATGTPKRTPTQPRPASKRSRSRMKQGGEQVEMPPATFLEQRDVAGLAVEPASGPARWWSRPRPWPAGPRRAGSGRSGRHRPRG